MKKLRRLQLEHLTPHKSDLLRKDVNLSFQIENKKLKNFFLMNHGISKDSYTINPSFILTTL